MTNIWSHRGKCVEWRMRMQHEHEMAATCLVMAPFRPSDFGFCREGSFDVVAFV